MVYAEGVAGPGVADFVMRFRVERRPSIGVPIGGERFRGSLSPALYRSADRLVPLSGPIQ
jgi:hypothetical protein